MRIDVWLLCCSLYLGISREWIPPVVSVRYLPEETSRITSSLYLNGRTVTSPSVVQMCTRETIITHHFTMGIGKPSTVQKSLTEAFSYTVCDLSLTRNCGPLIIGPSYTYLSSLFFFIYPESININLFY